jgi:hypothetical protein
MLLREMNSMLSPPMLFLTENTAIFAGSAVASVLQRLDAIETSTDRLLVDIASAGGFIGDDGDGERIVWGRSKRQHNTVGSDRSVTSAGRGDDFAQ